MTSLAKAKGSPEKRPDVELRPDGWERFKRAVSAAAKSGPKHRHTKQKKKRGQIRRVPNLDQGG
jgi:hypothetical protein